MHRRDDHMNPEHEIWLWGSFPWAQCCIIPKPLRSASVMWATNFVLPQSCGYFFPATVNPLDRLSERWRASLGVSADHNWSIPVLPLTHIWMVWRATSNFLKDTFFSRISRFPDNNIDNCALLFIRHCQSFSDHLNGMLSCHQIS